MRQQLVQEKKQHSFVQGAMILTLSTMATKIISSLFKIIVLQQFDVFASAYFNTAFDFFLVISAVSLTGLPAALSKMTSELASTGNYRDVALLKRVASRIFLGFGILGTLILFFGANLISWASGNDGATLALMVFAPSVLFLCLTSTQRGYYNGLRNMTPTAVSQVVEVVVKVVFGVLSVTLVKSIGLASIDETGTVFGLTPAPGQTFDFLLAPYLAAAAIFGVTLSTAAGALYTWIYAKRHGDGITREEMAASPAPRKKSILQRRFLAAAIPISIGAIVSSISNSVDTMTVSRRIEAAALQNPTLMFEKYGALLAKGDMALIGSAAFGLLGFGGAIYQLVPSFTTGFSVSALPNISDAWVSGDHQKLERNTRAVLWLTNIMAMPAAFLIIALASPMLRLVSGGQVAVVEAGAPILSFFGISVIFASMASPINAMLQGIGRVRLPVFLMAIGLVIKFVFNMILVGIPEIAMLGAPISTLLCYLFITGAGLWTYLKITGVAVDLQNSFIKPAIAGLICATAAFFTYAFLALIWRDIVAFIISMLVGGFFYLFSLIFLKGFRKEDVLMLPKGKIIAKILEKHRLLG